MMDYLALWDLSSFDGWNFNFLCDVYFVQSVWNVWNSLYLSMTFFSSYSTTTSLNIHWITLIKIGFECSSVEMLVYFQTTCRHRIFMTSYYFDYIWWLFIFKWPRIILMNSYFKTTLYYDPIGWLFIFKQLRILIMITYFQRLRTMIWYDGSLFSNNFTLWVWSLIFKQLHTMIWWRFVYFFFGLWWWLLIL